jgi:hypothetical protein
MKKVLLVLFILMIFTKIQTFAFDPDENPLKELHAIWEDYWVQILESFPTDSFTGGNQESKNYAIAWIIDEYKLDSETIVDSFNGINFSGDIIDFFFPHLNEWLCYDENLCKALSSTDYTILEVISLLENAFNRSLINDNWGSYALVNPDEIAEKFNYNQDIHYLVLLSLLIEKNPEMKTDLVTTVEGTGTDNLGLFQLPVSRFINNTDYYFYEIYNIQEALKIYFKCMELFYEWDNPLFIQAFLSGNTQKYEIFPNLQQNEILQSGKVIWRIIFLYSIINFGEALL